GASRQGARLLARGDAGTGSWWLLPDQRRAYEESIAAASILASRSVVLLSVVSVEVPSSTRINGVITPARCRDPYVLGYQFRAEPSAIRRAFSAAASSEV